MVLDYHPKLSVVVAAWNEEEGIESTVKGILSQKYRNDFEIIIVGGGNDKTPRICRKLAKDKRTRYIEEKKPGGKYNSLNSAISKAKHDIIAVIDADAVLGDSLTLSKLIQPLKEKTVGVNAGMQLPKREHFFERFQFPSLSLIQILYYGLARMGFGYWTDGACLSFKKEVWEKVKFKNYLLEDVGFSIEATKNWRSVLGPGTYVKARFPHNLKQFYKRNSRFYRGLVQLFLKFPLKGLILFIPPFWLYPFLLGFTSLNLFIINAGFFLFWFLVDKLLFGEDVGFIDLIFTIPLLFVILVSSVFYFFQWFSKKRLEWTRV